MAFVFGTIIIQTTEAQKKTQTPKQKKQSPPHVNIQFETNLIEAKIRRYIHIHTYIRTYKYFSNRKQISAKGKRIQKKRKLTEQKNKAQHT